MLVEVHRLLLEQSIELLEAVPMRVQPDLYVLLLERHDAAVVTG